MEDIIIAYLLFLSWHTNQKERIRPRLPLSLEKYAICILLIIFGWEQNSSIRKSLIQPSSYTVNSKYFKCFIIVKASKNRPCIFLFHLCWIIWYLIIGSGTSLQIIITLRFNSPIEHMGSTASEHIYDTASWEDLLSCFPSLGKVR